MKCANKHCKRVGLIESDFHLHRSGERYTTCKYCRNAAANEKNRIKRDENKKYQFV